MRRTPLLLSFALSLAACGEDAPSADPPTPPVATPEATPPAEAEAPEEAPAGTPAAAPSAEEVRTVATGLGGFSASVFRALAVPPAESAAIAPVSIAGALGMTAAGARGESQTEVYAALGVTALGNATPRVIGGMLSGLASDELSIANRLFARPLLVIEPAYVALTRDLFAAPVEQVDFGDATPARNRINRWVDEHTRHRIPEILPPGSVDGSTELVLVNAMSFLAPWQHAFAEADTREGTFHAPSGDVPSAMMHRMGEAEFAALEDASVLRLPYAGGRFAATFVLPSEGSTLEALEASMDGAKIATWLAAPASVPRVSVLLPRFRVEASRAFSLRTALASVGITALFDPDRADLSGIAPPATRPLVVSDVLHRVFIETTERGTEAAAATAVVMARGGMAAPTFVADRPFLFFVTEPATGLVLFMARVATPGMAP